MMRTNFVSAALAFYVVLAGIALAWVQMRGTRPAIARSGDWLLDVGLGLAAGLLLIALWTLGKLFSARFQELEDRVREIVGPLERHEILLIAGASGLAEELLFRGAMLPSWGLVVSTVIFGLLHTGPGPAFRVWTLFALLAGAVLGALVLWRETLLAAIVAHATVNGIQLARLAPRAAGEDRVDAPDP